MPTNKNMIFLSTLLLLLILTACQEAPESRPLSLVPLFADNMVLQQQDEVAFWGSYTPKEKITVSGSWGKEATTKADKNGAWKLQLSTPEAGGPFTVNIVTKDSTLILNDVMAGEVWLASGQSNMEMPLKGWPPNDVIQNSEEEVSNARYPKIRLFTVVKNLSVSPLDSIKGKWVVAGPETAGDFSATAYFFARRLHQELQIPIGIIHSSWGGTVAEAWTSSKPLKTLSDFDKDIAMVQDTSLMRKSTEWFSKWKSVAIPQTEEVWEDLHFDDLAAAQTDFSDTHWSSVNLPGRFDAFDSTEIDGSFWLRKKIMIDDLQSDYILTLGSVDDMDATYINGKKIGGMAGGGKYNLKRVYTVPKTILKKGENTIAIRAIDTGGPGIVGAPMVLSNQSGNSISLEGEWKNMPGAEIYNSNFYVYDITESVYLQRPNIIRLHPNLPTVLYNAMIHPLIPYNIKGAIWYQGESNVGRAEQYKKLFPAMIGDWRSRWKNDFPFYFVQIAPFRYHNGSDDSLDQSQKLREAQRQTLNTKNTGMVVTMDIGNFDNIHPANKQDVGFRLAGLALANDYGKSIVASGPLYSGVSFTKSGDNLLLHFDARGTGLIAKNGTLSGFEIAGSDNIFFPAKAKIVAGKVDVSAAEVADPKYARYAWRDNGVASLFNKEGLPASSFSTEE